MPTPKKRSPEKELRKEEIIETAKNTSGEVFEVGDYIIVKDLLRQPTVGIIASFYRGSNDEIWVVYSPAEPTEDEKWQWSRGFKKAANLVRADRVNEDERTEE